MTSTGTATDPHKVDIAWRANPADHGRWKLICLQLLRLQRDSRAPEVER